MSVGGGAVTEELFPGYRLSVCSYICHMLERKVIDDLELRKHGLHIYSIDPVSLFPFEDGSHYWAWHDAEKTGLEIGRMQGVSAADAEAYPRWIQFWEQAGGLLRRYFLRPPPTLSEIADDVRGTPDEQVFETLRTTSARGLVAEYFQDQRVAATALGCPDYGQISEPGSALAQAYFKTNLHTAHEDLGIVRGGMGGITQAMARSAAAAGVTIHTNAPVQKVVIEEGHARGVELENGESLSGFCCTVECRPEVDLSASRRRVELAQRVRLPGAVAQNAISVPEVPRRSQTATRLRSFSPARTRRDKPRHDSRLA